MDDVIIAIVGSRRRKDEDNVREMVRELYAKHGDKLIIVSGGCHGVDSWAEDEAKKLSIQLKIFKPNLKGAHTYRDVVLRYYERNKKIALFAKDGIIAFVAPDRKGGTENTIKHGKKLKRNIFINKGELS